MHHLCVVTVLDSVLGIWGYKDYFLINLSPKGVHCSKC